MKVAADLDSSPQHAEKVRGYDRNPRLLWSPVIVQDDLSEREHAGIVLEGLLRTVPHVDEIGVRKRQVPHMPLPQFHSRKHQPICILVGKRLQQHRIRDTENRSARPDAKCNRDNRGQGEQRAAREIPESRSSIL